MALLQSSKVFSFLHFLPGIAHDAVADLTLKCRKIVEIIGNVKSTGEITWNAGLRMVVLEENGGLPESVRDSKLIKHIGILLSEIGNDQVGGFDSIENLVENGW